VRVGPVTFFNELIDGQTTDWLFFARDPVPSDPEPATIG
jgi:hypothetical protein